MTHTWDPADMRDHFNEVAARLEYDAGLDRLTAEARAMAEIMAMLAGRTDATNAATNKLRTANRRDPVIYRYRAYQAAYMRQRRAKVA